MCLRFRQRPLTKEALIIFNDPLLIRIIAKFTGANLADAMPNPFYMAAWIGLLVTSLNLMPVGQLDGGHGTFALFGSRAHQQVGLVAFVTMALVAVLGFVWYGSPSGFLYTVLLAVMLKVRHPAPSVMEPLGMKRGDGRDHHLDRFCAVVLAVPYRDYVRSESGNLFVLQN